VRGAQGVDPELMWRMCFWAVVACLIGAHVPGRHGFWPEFAADPTVVFRRPGIRSIGGLAED